MSGSIINRLYSTFKSKNDLKNNQELLNRLKGISLVGGKKVLPKSEKPEEPSAKLSLERNLSFTSLNKLVKLNTGDPLNWNPSILCRIFNIPDNHCKHIAYYVKPFVYYANSDMDEQQQITRFTSVIDVERLKLDKNYLPYYQNLIFPQFDQKQSPLSYEDLIGGKKEREKIEG